MPKKKKRNRKRAGEQPTDSDMKAVKEFGPERARIHGDFTLLR